MLVYVQLIYSCVYCSKQHSDLCCPSFTPSVRTSSSTFILMFRRITCLLAPVRPSIPGAPPAPLLECFHHAAIFTIHHTNRTSSKNAWIPTTANTTCCTRCLMISSNARHHHQSSLSTMFPPYIQKIVNKFSNNVTQLLVHRYFSRTFAHIQSLLVASTDSQYYIDFFLLHAAVLYYSVVGADFLLHCNTQIMYYSRLTSLPLLLSAILQSLLHGLHACSITLNSHAHHLLFVK